MNIEENLNELEESIENNLTKLNSKKKCLI